ncbi:MAG: hypothetical protein QOF71_2129 [Candidatus Eremiobacteraeota bacterium]|nr:hypothetical protein [Candidatus Eremiobacteraeota bacterium]
MTAERVAGVGTFALVVAGVIAGFATTGPPQHLRAIELDHRRVSDLQTIERSVHDAGGRRRSEVDLVTAPLRGRDTWPRDPTTRQPYGYGRLSPTRYVICATFALPSDADGTTPATVSWRHGAGRTCYRLDANAVDNEPVVVQREAIELQRY